MRRALDFHLGLWTLILVAAASILFFLKPFERVAPAPSDEPQLLTLKAADQAGRLRVDWDPRSQVVQSAEAATLEVQDGGTFHRYPVSEQVLRHGGLDYVRKTGDVLLTLTLYSNGQPGQQATVRRIERLQPPATAEVSKPEPTRSRSQSRARRRR